MALAASKKRKMFSKQEILQLILCIGFHGFGLLASYVA
jgi:hypothetical protein